MGLIHDPGAEKRSLMMRRKPLCNGEKTGRSCIHYWVHVEKVESNNPDNLRLGEIYRACALNGASALHVHEMSESQLATVCNQYVPRRLPIWKRPLAVLGLVEDPGKYEGSVEDYKPLSPEEIKELQRGSPDDYYNPVTGNGNQTASPSDNIKALEQEIKENADISLEQAVEHVVQGSKND